MFYTILEAGTQAASEQAQTPQGSIGSSLIFFAVIMGIMYFLLIRPQQKKQKEMQKLIDSMQVNDKVVTASGIYGRVVSMKPDKGIVVLEIDDTNKVRVDFQKSAIVAIIKPEAQS